jgi:hypothetical protein
MGSPTKKENKLNLTITPTMDYSPNSPADYQEEFTPTPSIFNKKQSVITNHKSNIADHTSGEII